MMNICNTLASSIVGLLTDPTLACSQTYGRMGLSDQIMFDPSGSVSEVHGAFSHTDIPGRIL